MRKHSFVAATVALALTGGCAFSSLDGTVRTTDTAPAAPTTTLPEWDMPAVWPSSRTYFARPVDAATGFISTVLGMTPRVGEFRPTSADRGEIDVLVGEDVAIATVKSTLLLRRFRPDGGWFVTSASNRYVTIEWPDAGAIVPRGSLEVRGRARGFEGQVSIAIFAPADPLTPVDSASVLAGSRSSPEPYRATVDISDVDAGSVLGLIVRGGRGLEQDPGEFSAIFVTAG